MDELDYIAQSMKRFVAEYSTASLQEIVDAIVEEVDKRGDLLQLGAKHTNTKVSEVYYEQRDRI